MSAPRYKLVLASGGELLTFDSDFARVPGLPHTLLRP